MDDFLSVRVELVETLVAFDRLRPNGDTNLAPGDHAHAAIHSEVLAGDVFAGVAGKQQA